MMHDLKFGRSVGCFKSSTTYRFALHKHQEWKLVHARILLLGDEGPAGPRCTDRRSSRPWMSASRPSVACGGVS